jgi:hypothetical protein
LLWSEKNLKQNWHTLPGSLPAKTEIFTFNFNTLMLN